MGDGKKDWSKQMFELTRARDIRVFDDNSSEDSRGTQKQFDLLKVRINGESNDLECKLINSLAQCAFNTNEILPQ